MIPLSNVQSRVRLAFAGPSARGLAVQRTGEIVTVLNRLSIVLIFTHSSRPISELRPSTLIPSAGNRQADSPVTAAQ